MMSQLLALIGIRIIIVPSRWIYLVVNIYIYIYSIVLISSFYFLVSLMYMNKNMIYFRIALLLFIFNVVILLREFIIALKTLLSFHT